MIATQRLMIRPITIVDWKAIQAIWIDQSKSTYAPYIKPKPLDGPSVYHQIQRWIADSGKEHQYWAVCLAATVIGYMTLHKREHGYEIGYCYHSAYQGKGYARESLAAITEHVFVHGTSRVMAQTALKNIPSVKLLLSLGFKQIGTKEVSFFQDERGNDITFDDGVFELNSCLLTSS